MRWQGGGRDAATGDTWTLPRTYSQRLQLCTILRTNTHTLLHPVSCLLSLQSAAKDERIRRLEAKLLRTQQKSQKQQDRHATEVQALEEKYERVFHEYNLLMRSYNHAARAAEGAEVRTLCCCWRCVLLSCWVLCWVGSALAVSSVFFSWRLTRHACALLAHRPRGMQYKRRWRSCTSNWTGRR
jgi:hypothetical protein